MKFLCTLSTVLIVTVFMSTISFTQPLNKSFENWDPTTGMPVDWFSSGPPSVTQVSVAHEGSSSAHLEVIDIGGGFPFPPILTTIVPPNTTGHPVSEKHSSLLGWYQYMPLGNDQLFVFVSMSEGTSNIVGAGVIAIGGATSGWTQFTVPIIYFPGTPNPDNVFIQFTIIDTTTQFGTIGTMGYIDDLSLTDPSDVQLIDGLPEGYTLSQNYPNPFNPSTNIEYSIPEESFIELKVYDILGNEIATLVSEQQPAGVYRADFNADNKPAGLYFARLTANEFTKVIKMTLLK